MSKRASVDLEDGHDVYMKRQKLSHKFEIMNVQQEILSSNQLQQLLVFDQDVVRGKHGIQSFKAFLDSLQDEEGRSDRLLILKKYLHAQIPQNEEDKAAVYLSDIMQTWSSASQSNNDSLLSAVPAVLALLFKVIATELDFVPYGLRLGRTLLQKRQLELLSRGTTTNKSKDFVISPALRLLREVSIFDGGAFANHVFRARNFSLKGLPRNLGIRHFGGGLEDRRKPSVRTNALRFFLSLVKFLHIDAKKELLRQRDIVSGVTRDVNRDPSHVVVEFLDMTRVHILQDDGLPRDAKSKFLNAANLGRIAQLYGYTHEDDELPEDKNIEALVNKWLVLACTSPDIGLLNLQSGFYPKDVNADNVNARANPRGHFDLGLDVLDWANRYNGKVPVRNTVLSEFIQTLRPWSSTNQSDLLLAIFKVAPELVAHYFLNKQSFPFDPKTTSTWMGYSAFVFSVLQLPIPKFFGHQERYARTPPPTSIVIESILPQPANQKVLTRCLGQKEPLITFFVIRLLTVAFEKLQNILSMYREASGMFPIWNEAVISLKNEFCRRCPPMKDAINAFRSINDSEILQKQASSRLLVMYYEVIPQAALESKFDVSAHLSKILQLLESDNMSAEDKVQRVIQVENLFRIARCSPGMKWFNKAEDLAISPFTSMLRLLAEASSDMPLIKMRSIVDSIVKENGLLQSQTEISSVDALLGTLKAFIHQDQSKLIFQFVDNCALRCSSNPIKYIDALEQECIVVFKDDQVGIQDLPISLLLFAVAEQYTFVIKTTDTPKIAAITEFIAQYLAASLKISEDKKILKSLTKYLSTTASPLPKIQKVINRSRKLVDSICICKYSNADIPLRKTTISAFDATKTHKLEISATLSSVQLPGQNDNSPLSRWQGKEMDTLIEEGHIISLIYLLSSSTLSARVQSVTALSKINHTLKSSTYSEKEPLWLLLCELLETAKPVIYEKSLPLTVTGFAAAALQVLIDPLHVLYAKVNSFMTLGPNWEIDKLPLFHAVISNPPTLDDARHKELNWLLSYLLSSLVTREELAIFHKRRVFEKALGLYSNVYLGDNLREKILQIVWRATEIEGGSETLLRRFGVVSWLKAQVSQEDKKGLTAQVLLERLLETCSKERLKGWSGQSAQEILDSLVPPK